MRLQLGIGPGNCRVTPLLGGAHRDSGDLTCIGISVECFEME